MYPILKGKLIIKNQDLELYRNILSTLEKIGQFERELISDKSNYLLDLHKYEQKLQKQLSSDIYFDSVSGILTTSLDPQYRIEKNIRNEILVPPNYNVEELLVDDFQNIIRNLTDEEVEGTSWNLKFVLEEEFYLKINDNPLSVLTN